ncbi:MAG: mechanosensitive ion channel family protein [Gomphosphaeria aponina SAG 52.96 = DSM 107014]|uniref:Mechanosensitive ion channel family protein n=1 Tax=Gomphosphaeria aponina SAG 52.96 = DSM 107014 TaxID=1521640 RepID=A0A941GYE5_9CHRO|nr:mechanosensitive ion channel family protein [Gomphosphaeria aponina SAG 52.96 = DSM 107014]
MNQAINILIIVGEVSIIISSFALSNWLLNKTSQQLMKITWLQQRINIAKILPKIQKILIIAGTVISLIVITGNSWVIYQGKNLREYTQTLVSNIPQAFWVQLAIGIFKSIIILIIAQIGLKYLHQLLKKTSDRSKQLEQININDESIEKFFQALDTSLSNSTWLLTIIWSFKFLKFPEIVPQYLHILLKIYLIISISLLLLKATDVIIKTIDSLSKKYSSTQKSLRFYEHLRHLLPFLNRCLEAVIYVAIASLIMQQIELIADLAGYGLPVVKIIGIIFLSRVFIEISKLGMEEILLKNQNLTDIEKKKRLTIIPLIQSLLKYLIYFGTGIAILYIINIDPTPILAGAGIIGLAVGLGAQNLINDMVCGFFILFDNYFLVGDFIETDDVRGIVESIELRTTRIRHPDGHKFILRNGDITKIINYSQEYLEVDLNIGVSYETDLDKAYQIIETVGKQLKETDPNIIEATEVAGVQEFGEYQILIRTCTKVKPFYVKAMPRIFRKMIKEAFEQEGIEIPYLRPLWVYKQQENNHVN